MFIDAPQFDPKLFEDGTAVKVSGKVKEVTGIIFDFHPLHFKIGFPQMENGKFVLSYIRVFIDEARDGTTKIEFLK